MSEGQQEWAYYKSELERLSEREAKLDSIIEGLDFEMAAKQKEWAKKIEFEEGMVERCREFMES